MKSINEFEESSNKIFGHQFILAGHSSQLPHAGSYICVEHLGESIIICRKEQGKIDAFANVCRHRGSRIVKKDAGRVDNFVCPYHGWKYDLSGKLIDARLCGPMLELQLVKIPIIEQSGFLFISLKDTQLAEFEVASSELFQLINPFEPASLKLAAYRDFPAKANWLLFLQNFLECYHCHSSHQFLRRSEAFIDLYEEGLVWKSIALDSKTKKRAIANGKPYVSKECDSRATIFWGAQSSTLLTDSETVSGNLVGCELGNFSSDDRSFIYGNIGPFNHFTILPDQIVFFRFMPVSDAETHARIYWFIHQDTQLNENSLEDMMGFWIQTLNEDIELTEAVQLNSASQFMMPSIFLQYEQNAKRLTNWVKNQLKK